MITLADLLQGHHARVPHPVSACRAGVPLAQGEMLAAAPTVGLVFTMVGWGALADRFRERIVITSGLALTAAITLLAALLCSGTSKCQPQGDMQLIFASTRVGRCPPTM